MSDLAATAGRRLLNRRSDRVRRPLKVSFVSLGCAKNLVDCEKMLGALAEAD